MGVRVRVRVRGRGRGSTVMPCSESSSTRRRLVWVGGGEGWSG